MATSPLVSVLMPAFNSASTIVSALRSVLNQQGVSFEVVVVDDGSDDATPAILRAFAEKNPVVRLVRQENRGIPAALNTGLSQCRGKYIARMDADDICLPWRLRLQVRFMEENLTVAASGTSVLPFQAKAPWIGLPVKCPTTESGVRTRLLFNPPIMHPTAIFRAEIIDRTEFYSLSMPQAQDFELWSRLAGTRSLSNIPTVCLLYRRSAKSISQSNRASQQSRAAELRMANLRRYCGNSFATNNGVAHAEIMVRQHAPESLVRMLPAYIDNLIATGHVEGSVVLDHWFGYCRSYSRVGGNGARLFAAARTAKSSRYRWLFHLL